MSTMTNRDNNSNIIGYILCIVLGIVICIWPGAILLTLCRIAGCLILLFGIFRLIACMKDPYMAHRGFPMFIGVVLCVVGIWILSAPGTFLKLIPVVIGILLIYQGVRNIYISIAIKKAVDSRWWATLLIGILSVIFGLVLIKCAFAALKIGMIILGIALIYVGVTGLWTGRGPGGSGGFGGSGGKRRNRVIDADYREL